MIKASLTRLTVTVAGLGLALTAGAGIAAAAPLDSMVNTTCSYPQVMSALNAQDPAAAAQFNASSGPSMLQQFLGAPPPQRRQMANMMANYPANQPYLGLIEQVFNSCNNF